MYLTIWSVMSLNCSMMDMPSGSFGCGVRKSMLLATQTFSFESKARARTYTERQQCAQHVRFADCEHICPPCCLGLFDTGDHRRGGSVVLTPSQQMRAYKPNDAVTCDYAYSANLLPVP